MNTLNVNAQIIPVRNANGKTYDYIDTLTKKTISIYAYDQASPFVEGMARVNRNGLFGFINTNGEEFIPCKYIHANDFSEGLASVSIGTQEITENTIWVRDEKYGVIDKTGQKVISFEFNEIAQFKNGIARAREMTNRKWGWIDNRGNWHISPKFESADDFNDLGMAKVGVNYDSNGYIDSQGNFLINPVYYELGDFVDGLARAKNWGPKEKYDGKYGFINIKGEYIVPFKYDNVQEFSENLALVGKRNNNGELKFGFIDKKGIEQIALKYEYGHSFSNGMAYVKQDSKFGWINKFGKYEIPNVYELAIDFLNANNAVPYFTQAKYFEDDDGKIKVIDIITYENALVSKNGLFGVIDNKGKEIIPIKYDSIARIKDGFVVNKASENICFNKWGQQIKIDIKQVDLENSWLWLKERGISINFSCELHEKFKSKFNINSPNNYTKIENYEGFSFEEGYLKRVEYRGKWGVVEIIGDKIKELIMPDYDDVGILPNTRWGSIKLGLIPVKRNKLWGFFDSQSQQLKIPYQFQNTAGFDNRDGIALCLVKKNNKWGVINNRGELISDYLYEDALCYAHGLCAVKKDGKWGFINEFGSLVTPCIFDWVTIHYELKSLVKINKMEILVDEYGNWIY